MYIKNIDDIPAEVLKILQPGNIFITMGAGDIWKVSNELANQLREN